MACNSLEQRYKMALEAIIVSDSINAKAIAREALKEQPKELIQPRLESNEFAMLKYRAYCRNRIALGRTPLPYKVWFNHISCNSKPNQL